MQALKQQSSNYTNIFVDSLPTSYITDYAEYKVNTDFRCIIIFERFLHDESISKEEALYKGMYIFFNSNIPEDIAKATDYFIYFYNCGHPVKSASNQECKRIYDFDMDSQYIYAAFLEQYGINLINAAMHWWEFNALFKSLNPETKISKIMLYRSIEISSSMSQKEKEFYLDMKKLYSLSDIENEDQENDELFDILTNSGDLSILN